MSDENARMRVLSQLKNAGVAASIVQYAEEQGYGRDSALWEFADLLGLTAQAMHQVPANTQEVGDQLIENFKLLINSFAEVTTKKQVEFKDSLEKQTVKVNADSAAALARLVSDAVHDISHTEAKAHFFKGIATAIGAAALMFIVCGIGGWYVAKTHYDQKAADLAHSYNQQLRSIAEILTTPEGKAAIVLAENGSAEMLANCTLKNARIQFSNGRTYCVPAKNIGWAIK